MGQTVRAGIAAAGSVALSLERGNNEIRENALCLNTPIVSSYSQGQVRCWCRGIRADAQRLGHYQAEAVLKRKMLLVHAGCPKMCLMVALGMTVWSLLI